MSIHPLNLPLEEAASSIFRQRLRSAFGAEHELVVLFEEVAQSVTHEDLQNSVLTDDPHHPRSRLGTLLALTVGGALLGSSSGGDLGPIRVATVLRNLQSAAAKAERGINVTLELDDSLHVNVNELLLSSVLDSLVQNVVEGLPSDALISLRCRAEERGVLIEIEGEGGVEHGRKEPAARSNERSRELELAITQRCLAAAEGELTRPREHAFCVTFPSARPSRASSRPPAFK